MIFIKLKPGMDPHRQIDLECADVEHGATVFIETRGRHVTNELHKPLRKDIKFVVMGSPIHPAVVVEWRSFLHSSNQDVAGSTDWQGRGDLQCRARGSK